MNSLSRRLGRCEERLNVGPRRRVIHIKAHRLYAKGTAPDISEPCEQWLTYKTALEEAVEKGDRTGIEILHFKADPFREYEVRNGLPDGILSKHELKGQIPFQELLTKATKNNQKQPKTKK